MRRHRAGRLWPAALGLTALIVAACSSGSASTTSNGTKPIVIGMTASLTGQFSADGHALQRGYELWASDVNTHGGLLGRPVQLKILNDNSNPNTVSKDYTQLITSDHVNLTVGPYSSLLTGPAGQVAAKYHYALTEGAGSAPLIFGLKLHNLFGVSAPIQAEMKPFAAWVAALPPGQRPVTAAYPMVQDPFADPPVQATQATLQRAGVRTVYSHIIANPKGGALAAAAAAVAKSHAQAVVLGSVDVPTVLAFIHVFEKQKYTPKMLIAAAGPDQGAAFLNYVGRANANGIMVPDGWYGAVQNALSHVMVQEYIAKYGGTSSSVNADVAEAYSAGEAMAAAVTGTHSLNQAKLISYLHAHTLQTVQGPAKFDSVGRNDAAPHFIFQWQNGQFLQVLPVNAPGSARLERTKQAWLRS
ncbi:MAG TPA: ABC transporter substrate-binding protein [Streptosporangiaceae bacterium]|jgi:branched-chain amino acid transport system substrate-binding protein|nr:ABC transporter substrate-binding protein [Streptosporangiaceae bacterium]